MEGDRQRRCRASMHARKLRPSGKTPAALSGLLLAIAFCPQLGFTRLADEWQPVGKCEVLGKQYDCGLRDGCEWCVNETAATGPSCMGWEKCTGPAALCDLKEDNATCTSPLCAWCQMQGRCIRADGPVEVNGTAGSQGQCVGCDGVRDSGATVDACGTCAGPCLHPFVTPKNPGCFCLGCDLVPFSHKVVDHCGVCGGDNSTCNFNFTLQQRIGIALALSGNCIISVSLNIQKYTHNLNLVESNGERPYTEIPLWWLGMGLMFIGEAGNFLAYAYAPATLVAPLGAVSVMCNSLLAHYVLKEEMHRNNLAGVFLAVMGASLIVAYAPTSEQTLTMELLEAYMSQASFIVFILLILASMIGLFLLDDYYKKRYVVVYLLICALSGSLTVMSVKGVSTAVILTLSGEENAFTHLLPWVLVVTLSVTAVLQVRILNLAMINFGASEVVPVYYVLFTMASIGSGMVLYKEYHQNCAPGAPYCNNTIYFLLGCAITFSGVFLITMAPIKESERARRSYLFDAEEDENPLSRDLLEGGEGGGERDGLLGRGNTSPGQRAPPGAWAVGGAAALARQEAEARTDALSRAEGRARIERELRRVSGGGGDTRAAGAAGAASPSQQVPTTALGDDSSFLPSEL